MDNTNYKGLLQEYCQKKQLPLPIYDFDKVNDMWKAKLSLPFSDEIYYGECEQTKIKSAQNVAKKAYNIISTLDTKIYDIQPKEQYPLNYIVKTSANKPIYILVDFENVPQIDLLEIFAKKHPDIILLTFASVNHSKCSLVDYIVPTTTKDATDHFIGLYMGMLIQAIQEKLLIIVITKDHFGEIFEIIYNKLNDPRITVKHFTNQNLTIKYLETNKDQITQK
jgi:hypothetical protein